MKRKSYWRRMLAAMLTIVLLPFSDFVGVLPVNASEISVNTEAVQTQENVQSEDAQKENTQKENMQPGDVQGTESTLTEWNTVSMSDVESFGLEETSEGTIEKEDVPPIVETLEVQAAHIENGKVEISWKAFENTVKYCIYRDEVLLEEILPQQDTEEEALTEVEQAEAGQIICYVDGAVEAGRTYSYHIEVYGEEGLLLAEGTLEEFVIPGNMVVTANSSLSGNQEVYNLVLNGGTLDLRGYQLTVYGSVTVNNATLYMNGGFLDVYGDFTLNYNAVMRMENANDYLLTRGNMNWNNYSVSCNTLNNGKIELWGDFNQMQYESFQASGYHKMIFSGSKKQSLYLKSIQTKFATVELKNTSTEGVHANCIFLYDKLITEDSRLSIGEDGSILGYTLQEDEVIDGDVVLCGGVLDLNGHNLTVNGDMIQMMGEVCVNGGSLIVKGDYRMQSRTEAVEGTHSVEEADSAGTPEEKTYIYAQGGGFLTMTNEQDYVLVEGDFYAASRDNQQNHMSAGTLEVKGNFTQDKIGTLYSFYASGSHTTVFSGDENQKISFGYSGSSGARFHNIVFQNTGEKITVSGTPFVAGIIDDQSLNVFGYMAKSGTINIKNGIFSGSLYLYANGQDAVFNSTVVIGGDVYAKANTVFSSKVTVGGNFTKFGHLWFNNGTLKVDGNLYTERGSDVKGIHMENPGDYLLVGGDFEFYCSNPYYRMTDGILEVKGNLNVGAYFYAEGNHKVILSGNQKQTIALDSNSYLATLELFNESEEGVYAPTTPRVAKLIRNGCKLSYGDVEGTFGYQLTQDEVIDGDFVLLDDCLDLNGYTLTVEGNFIQNAGEVKINGGSLHVGGDYRMQSRTESGTDSETGEIKYTYSQGNGYLTMTDDADYVLVEGSFNASSSDNQQGHMTAGTLEVKGNFSTDQSYGFYPTGSHTTVFSGKGAQTIRWGTNSNLGFHNVVFDNSSNGKITISGMPYVSGKIDDRSGNVSGYLAQRGTLNIVDNIFSGSLFCPDKMQLTKNLTIGGNLTLRSDTVISADVCVGGNVLVSQTLIFNNGTLKIGGDFGPDTSYSSSLYGISMAHDSDYMLVNGNFVYRANRLQSLSKGVLEVKGNFQTYSLFCATGSHKVILSGDKKQTVTMDAASNFATIELQNYSEDGVYATAPLSKITLIRNNCKLDYAGMEGLFGYTLSEDVVVEGDLVLLDDCLDLNGYTLTVTGDFIQAGGEVKVNEGSLIVGRDYRMQMRKENGTDSVTGEKKYTYSLGAGYLTMTAEADYVLVQRDFYAFSNGDQRDHMTAGLLEVKGSFTQGKTGTDYSFYAGGTHTTLFSGNVDQYISFATQAARFQNIVFDNQSEKKITVSGTPYVAGTIEDKSQDVKGYLKQDGTLRIADNRFSGGLYIYGNDCSITNDLKLGGDLYVKSTTTVSAEVTVGGNLTVYGPLRFQHGTVKVAGSYYTDTAPYRKGISMTHADDYLLVNGDFDFYTGSENNLENGIIEVKGNFKASNFYAYGNHKVILSGDRKQTLNMHVLYCFATLELRNYSKEGVCALQPFERAKLIRNGCKITVNDMEGTYGWTLQDDYVVEEDFILIEDVLDLNGHTLTVNGDFIHAGGELQINHGQLIVTGDYRLQSFSGKEGSYTYGNGNGKLVMKNSDDYFCVQGGMYVSLARQPSTITDGILEVKGNFVDSGNYAFITTGEHTLVLSGTEKQQLKSGKSMVLMNLEITNTNKVSVDSVISVKGTLSDVGQVVSGSGRVDINSLTQLKDYRWGGNLGLSGTNTLKQNLSVGGLYLTGTLYCNGYDLISSGYIDVVGGNFYLQNSYVTAGSFFGVATTGTLYMQNPDGYILVYGTFILHTSKTHRGCLTAGTLEVQGDFTQNWYVNFQASDEHTVILSRKRTTSGRNFVQTVSCSSSTSCHFATLILKKQASEYQCNYDLESLASKVIYDIEDDTAPTAVTGMECVQKSETSVTIRYSGAADESGIAGYEIYRNGVKVGVTSGATFTDESVAPSTTYEYTVFAFDMYRNRCADSPKLSVTTDEDTQAPGMPTNLGVTKRTGSSVTLSWTKPTDNVKVWGYRIYRDDTLISENCTSTSYRDTGLLENEVYSYTVEAFDEAGNISEKSKVLKACVGMPKILEVTPADLSQIGGTSVTVSCKFKDWGNSTGNRVRIEYSADNGETWTQMTPTALGQKKYDNGTLYVSCQWTLPASDTTQEYEVRFTLMDADNNTDSQTITLVVDKEAPQIPGNVTAVSENQNISLSWDMCKSADCAAYEIYRGTVADGQTENVEKIEYTLIATLKDRYRTYYMDCDVEEGVTYCYYITAKDYFANTSQGSDKVTVTADKDLARPTIVSMTPKAGRINGTADVEIKAKDNVSVTKLVVSLSTDKENWELLEEMQATADKRGEEQNISYLWDTTALTDGIHFLRVVAVDEAGNESEGFVTKYEVDNTGAGQVVISGYETTSTAVTLHWQDVEESDFAYFQIERVIGQTSLKIGTVSNLLGYTIEGLAPDTTYEFVVVAYDNLGNRGVPSQKVSITTSSDTTKPIITAVYPISSYYKDSLPLSMTVKDNAALGYGRFSVSTDKTTYKEVATVTAGKNIDSTTFTYDMSLADYEEGNIYILFEAYDQAGNKNALLESGEEIVAEYRIDRTPPGSVENVFATGSSGCVALTWDAGKEDDIAGYRIYRAQEKDGIFSVIKDCTATLNYYDASVAYGTTYIYKVAAVDIAGNEGECSKEVVSTVYQDTVNPIITGIYPKDGDTIGALTTIYAVATDNAALHKVTMEYRRAGEDGTVWQNIGTKETEGRVSKVSQVWDVTSLEEGSYEVRAYAQDKAGNLSDMFTVTYQLDLTPPCKPALEATPGCYSVKLSVGTVAKEEGEVSCQESDFSHYAIYRKEIGSNKDFIKIATTKEPSYEDTEVAIGEIYLYKVRSVDAYGNYAESEEVSGYADAKDTIVPTAVLPENLVGMVGYDVAFDGTASRDNVRIVDFAWDMGDGTKLSGSQPVHAYEKAGFYTVTLTVKDAAGNKSTTTCTAQILEKTGKGLARVTVMDEMERPIPYAYVSLKLGEGDVLNLQADSLGKVTVGAAEGAYCMAAYQTGYLPKEMTISISQYQTNEYTISLESGELVTGSLKVERMELEEMIEAGVDFSNPANYNQYKFQVSLTFSQMPIPIEVWYTDGFILSVGGMETEKQGGSVILKNPDGQGGNIVLTTVKRQETENTDLEEQEEIPPTLAYLSTTQSVSWLKEMYNVELGIINQAQPQFVLTDCRAALNLPNGLTLAELKTEQNPVQEMPDIAGQSCASASWIVKGDTSGTYSLSADFGATLMPFEAPVSASFATETEFEVQTGEGIHIYIKPEASAYINDLYYIQFEMVNESERTFYNFTTSLGGYQEPRDYQQTMYYDLDTGERKYSRSETTVTMVANAESTLPIIYSDDKVRINAFYPNDRIKGTYATRFVGTGDEDFDYYSLIDTIVSTLEGNNLGVKVTVCDPIPSHGVRKVIAYHGNMLIPQNTYGDPIDTATGAFVDTRELLKVSGASELSFEMQYDSMLTDEAGELGYGWHHNYETYLVDHNGILEYHVSPDSYVPFYHVDYLKDVVYGKLVDNQVILQENAYFGEYSCSLSGMEKYQIVKNEDGTYTVNTPDKTEFRYDALGRLTHVKTDAESVTVSYGDKQRIITEDISGVRLKCNYSEEGYLTTVSDDTGRSISFTYENGMMTSFTDAGGNRTSLQYQDRLIVSETSANGITYVQNTYDEKGRVLSQKDAAPKNAPATFDYQDTADGTTILLTAHDGSRTTIVTDKKSNILSVTDARGGVTGYTYDREGNLVAEQDAEGNSVFYEYDEAGNLTASTDVYGNTTSYQYDEDGLLTKVTGTSGYTTQMTYEEGRKKSVIGPLGETAEYEYTSFGKLSAETTKGLGTNTYTYTNGLLSGMTDYNGNTTTIAYDGVGNVIATTDALGNTSTFAYDAVGNKIRETDALGNTTAYAYDCNNHMVLATDCLGNETAYEYDGNGRQTKTVYADGTWEAYTLDGEGRTVRTDYSDGTYTATAYDACGNVISFTDVLGNRTTYAYDSLNRMISETNANGDTVTYSYYHNQKPYRVTYPNGGSVTYTYDSSWRLIRQTDSEGHSTSYTYDAGSNITSVRDALGNTTYYTYDFHGRLLSMTDANGGTTSYTYDGNGNCLSVTNALGEVTTYEYDAKNQMIRSSRETSMGIVSVSFGYDALGRVVEQTNEEGNTVSVTYDGLSRITQMTDAKGNIIQSNTYDSMGNVTATRDALGIESTYSYDVAGNLTRAVQYLNTASQRSHAYRYDKAGQLLEVTDPLEGISSYTYDGVGNICTVTDPNGGVEHFTYDAVGNLTEHVNAIGCQSAYTYNALGLLTEAVDANGDTREYTYDALGRISTMTDGEGTITYTYDKVGNVLTVSDGKGTLTRTYDALNRVKTYTDYKGNTVSYSYDELGNLVSLTYPGGEIVRYTYYKTGWLQSASFGDGESIRYTYDENGRLVTTRRSNGTVETRSYDAAGHMLSQKEEKVSADGAGNETGEVLYEYLYTYDDAGNVTEVSGLSGGSAERIVSAAMTYDAANRLVTYNGETVEYDRNGNMTYGPLKGQMTAFRYDCRNRLVQAGDTVYTYDAENARIAMETADYREEYVVDKNTTYSRVLTAIRYEKKEAQGDTSAAGGSRNGSITEDAGQVTTYYYGRGLVAQTDEKRGFLFYHYNHLGSTMALTDLSGEAVQEYAYDIYGKCILGDATFTRFLYNGKYGVTHDDNGLLYMRSRYYNTEIRRFLNQDVILGSITDSQSLNRYSYVQGNPVSYTDPFGLSPEEAEQEEAMEATENWGWHVFLDVLGMVPVVGVIAGVANGLLYLSEGNIFMAVGEFCFAAADLILPAASALKLGGNALKAADMTAGVLRTGGYVIGAYTQLREAMQATADFVLAADDGRFAADKFLTAASSYAFAATGIGKAVRSAGKAFRAGKELFGDVLSGIGRQAGRSLSLAGNNGGFADLDVLSGKSSAGKGGTGALSTPSSKVLRQNLIDAGVEAPDYPNAAHHIVAGNSPKAAEARAILQKYGIDINDSANGVFLPTVKDVAEGAYHPSLHTNAYYDEINNLLSGVTSKQEALDVLNYISESLQNGTFMK